MSDDGPAQQIDESLVRRVSSLSRDSQRWLRTAIQAIRSSEVGPAGPSGEGPEPEEEPRREKPPLLKPAANLEDVITGKADLREQLESYPELSNELEGLADVIDLLREAGERRRKRGEELLRELLEGEGEGPAEEEHGEEPPEEDGEEPPPRRPRR